MHKDVLIIAVMHSHNLSTCEIRAITVRSIMSSYVSPQFQYVIFRIIHLQNNTLELMFNFISDSFTTLCTREIPHLHMLMYSLCNVYVVVIFAGHVDAGKSTLMGHLLYLLGNVSKKSMHKYPFHLTSVSN